MLFVITVGVVVIAISCLFIEVQLRKSYKQRIEIIELLKRKEE